MCWICFLFSTFVILLELHSSFTFLLILWILFWKFLCVIDFPCFSNFCFRYASFFPNLSLLINLAVLSVYLYTLHVYFYSFRGEEIFLFPRIYWLPELNIQLFLPPSLSSFPCFLLFPPFLPLPPSSVFVACLHDCHALLFNLTPLLYKPSLLVQICSLAFSPCSEPWLWPTWMTSVDPLTLQLSFKFDQCWVLQKLQRKGQDI